MISELPASLEWRTERLVGSLSTEVASVPTDSGDLRCWSVRTPANPIYVWGNCLHFSRPPRVGESGAWITLHKRAFPELAPWKFHCFSWDTVDKSAEVPPEFYEQGYELGESLIYATPRLHRAPTQYEGLEVKPFTTDAEWAEDLEYRLDFLGYTKQHQIDFLRYRFEAFRDLVRAKRGQWYGARFAGEWMGSMGIFWGGGLARYQEVMTHAAYRRRSICRTMCYAASELALRECPDIQLFVTAAERDGPACSSYESLGFTVREISRGLAWINRAAWG